MLTDTDREAEKYAAELREIAGMLAQTEDGPLRWKQYRLTAIADYLPTARHRTASTAALTAEIQRLREELRRNQAMLEAIDRHNSTNFTEVRQRIVANRSALSTPSEVSEPVADESGGEGIDDRFAVESLCFSPGLQRYHHARMVKHARHARPSGCAWLRAAKRSLRDPLTHSARGGFLELSGRGTSVFFALPLAGRTRNETYPLDCRH